MALVEPRLPHGGRVSDRGGRAVTDVEDGERQQLRAVLFDMDGTRRVG
jgi:hypothetical protein